MKPPCFSGRSPCRPQRLFSKPVSVTGDTRPALPRTVRAERLRGQYTERLRRLAPSAGSLSAGPFCFLPIIAINCNIGFILVFFPLFVKEFICENSAAAAKGLFGAHIRLLGGIHHACQVNRPAVTPEAHPPKICDFAGAPISFNRTEVNPVRFKIFAAGKNACTRHMARIYAYSAASTTPVRSTGLPSRQRRSKP